MKYAIIPIMALLLIGSAFAMALPKEDNMVCLTCNEEPQPVEPVVVVVDEPRNNNDNRRMDQCDFDVKRPRCMTDVWNDDKKMIVNGKEYAIDYDYRKSRDTIIIGEYTAKMEKAGAFLQTSIKIDGRTFKVMKHSNWRMSIKEI
jgi:hypothetical protein